MSAFLHGVGVGVGFPVGFTLAVLAAFALSWLMVIVLEKARVR